VNDTFSSKKDAVDFGKWWATTVAPPVTILPAPPPPPPPSAIGPPRSRQAAKGSAETVSGGAIAGIVIGNIVIFLGIALAVFLVGRHYHIKKLKEQIAKKRQMMLQLQQAQMEAGGVPPPAADGGAPAVDVPAPTAEPEPSNTV
jgi:hypothetical protein